MIEEDIQELLSVEKGTKKISLVLPRILLDKLLAGYRKKVGAIKDHGLMSSALFYFAARGVLDFEEKSGASSDLKQETPAEKGRRLGVRPHLESK